MHTPVPLAALVAALVAASGCSDDPAGPDNTPLAPAEALALAATMDAGSGNAITSLAVALEQTGQDEDPEESATEREVDFQGIAPCPQGGQVRLEGDVRWSYVHETSTLAAEFAATLTHSSCTLEAGGSLLTLDGNPNLEIAGELERVDGQPSGLQTITHVGSVTWTRSTGESGTCDVDLLGVVDPDAGTKSVTGTFCGYEVESTSPWPPGSN